MIRRDRRKIKEQLFKGSQRAVIRQRSLATKICKSKEFCSEIISRNNSKCKLQEFAKKLKDNQYESEDEEEIINLNETIDKENYINDIYREKNEEISKAKANYREAIKTCKDKMLPLKVIKKLEEKEMMAITNISDKFCKKLIP